MTDSSNDRSSTMRHLILAGAAAALVLASMPVNDAASAELERGRPYKTRKSYRVAPGEEVIVIRRYGSPVYRYQAFDYYGPIRPADYGPYDPYRPYYYRYPYAAEPLPYGFWWW